MRPPIFLEVSNLHRLHERVCDGDEKARDSIAKLLLDICLRSLRTRWPRVDPEMAADSVENAVMSYLSNPGSIDLERGQLVAIVALASRRNVIDQLRSESARKKRETAWSQEIVRLSAADKTTCGAASADPWPRLLKSRGPITNEQWRLVEPVFPAPRRRSRGTPAAPIRTVLDALIERLRQADRRWQDLQCGNRSYRTYHRHFVDWCRSGVLREALDQLEADLRRRSRP